MDCWCKIDHLTSGWVPLLQNPAAVEIITKMVDKWIGHLTEYKRLECKELVPCDRLAAIITTTRLFDALATIENGVDPSDSANFVVMLENWFIFCLVWGIGGSLDDKGRKSMDAVVREMDSRFPSTGTVFDCVIDVPTRTWVLWESRLSASFRPPPGVQFCKVLVPTADTIRCALRFLIRMLISSRCECKSHDSACMCTLLACTDTHTWPRP
jgi:dynein heavy chain, axonemal